MKTLLLVATLLLQQPAVPPAAGTIAGHITYADGTPYAGYLMLAGEGEAAKADDSPFPKMAVPTKDGEFRFTGVAPGRYSIRAVSAGPEELATVTVGTAPDLQPLNIALPPAMTGFRVSGHVSFTPGIPKPPTEVVGMSESGRIYGPISEDGTFELTHVREGSYSFQVSPANDMQPIVVLVDREIRGMEFAMPKPVEVAGTVTLQGRDTPAGTLTFDGPGRSVAPIQANGTLRALLIEGEYRVHADGLPAGYYIESLTSGERDLLKGPLQIVASDKPVPLAVRLAASNGVSVSGHVTGLAGENRSVRVTLNGTVASTSFDAAVNADGSYSIAKVMPGVYAARVAVGASVASSPLAVVIPNKNVADLEIAYPPPVEISGRVTVDGGGPPPKFTLYLAQGAASGDAALDSLKRSAAAGGLQLIQLDVDALSDGSFKFRIPAGTYRVATQRAGIPSAYFLRSVTYAGANLLTDSLVVSDKESSEMQLGFGTTDPNPWVKVSGRVVGLDSGMGPFRVALDGETSSAIETSVSPDGTFEFARVLRNSRYSATVLPENKFASTPRVSVAAKDVANVEIVIAKERELTGRVRVDGGGQAPNFMLELRAPSSLVTVLVKPDASGMFRIKVPGDERAVQLNALPFGYMLKSLTYGDTNLHACIDKPPVRCSYPPLKVGADSVTELQIQFELDPEVPFAKISGQIRGLNADTGASGNVRLVLSDPASYNTFEESVGADGSFAFSSLPQGTYVPSLTGSARSGFLRPSLIRVNGATTSGVVMEYSSEGTKKESASLEDDSTGARISEFGASNGGTAEEAAAVAILRTMNTAEVTYLSVSAGKWGSISELIEAELLPKNFESGLVSGYQLGLVHNDGDFVLAAIPDVTGHGRFGFYVVPDGVVRYTTIDSLAPPSKGGLPVTN